MKHRCGILLASASSLLLFASIAAAHPAPTAPTPSAEAAAKTASGIVTTLDKSRRSFVLTDDAGGKTTIHWNDATHFAGGEMYEGALVKVQTAQKDDQTLAVSIVVRPARSY
jgi:hypothetical protein